MKRSPKRRTTAPKQDSDIPEHARDWVAQYDARLAQARKREQRLQEFLAMLSESDYPEGEKWREKMYQHHSQNMRRLQAYIATLEALRAAACESTEQPFKKV